MRMLYSLRCCERCGAITRSEPGDVSIYCDKALRFGDSIYISLENAELAEMPWMF